jgi:hypothetical protein
MTAILAHRGNVNGARPATENRLPAIREALALGWGVEIDIRRAADSRFYISKDPRPSADGRLADELCALFRRHPGATVAVNVREIGGERELLSYLQAQEVLGQSFLVDTVSGHGDTVRVADRFRQVDPNARVATCVSDRHGSIADVLSLETASIVWIDEVDRRWFTENDVRCLKEAGHQVYVVSPDLHGLSIAHARRRWTRWCQWNVDGVCTAYPALLQSLMTGSADGAVA